MELKTKTNNIKIEIYEEFDVYYIVGYDCKTQEKVGFVNFKLKNGNCWLYNIQVEENFQGLGYGKALGIYFEKFCSDRRINFIEGKYYPTNENAKFFYKNRNYKIEKEDYEWFVSKFIDKEKLEEDYKNIIVESKEIEIEK